MTEQPPEPRTEVVKCVKCGELHTIEREAASAPPEPPRPSGWHLHPDNDCPHVDAAPSGLSLDQLEAAIRAAFEEDSAHFGKRGSPDEYRMLAHYIIRRLDSSGGTGEAR